MPATAGRVRMPANNRVHSSAALQTHGIWQSAIGYDPYAPLNNSPNKSINAEPKAENKENPYANFQGLMALARVTASNSDHVVRGACKKCGRVGHLTFQCRNVLGNNKEKKDLEAIHVEVVSGLDRNNVEEESESSDSDVDSEIERIIAERSVNKSKNEEKSDSVLKKKKRGRWKKNRRRGDTLIQRMGRRLGGRGGGEGMLSNEDMNGKVGRRRGQEEDRILVKK